jgi:hypothetical protein
LQPPFVIDLTIKASLSVTSRAGALLVSRIRPEDGIGDAVLERWLSLRHVVLEELRNYLRFCTDIRRVQDLVPPPIESTLSVTR